MKTPVRVTKSFGLVARTVAVAVIATVGVIPSAPPVSAATTTATFTLETSSTIGLLGVDATYANSDPGGYERMIRWSADGRLWDYNQTLGSSTFGWRTGQTNGVTVSGSPRQVRLELYPHPTTTCSGTNESEPCYWLTYDPWSSTRGGVHVQVESTQGANWLDIGTIRLPTLGVAGAFRMDGDIVSSSPVADGRVSIDLFQVDCSWHETCVHPPVNERGNELGGFASSTNRGVRWTGGVVWPGQYIVFIKDNLRGVNVHGFARVDADHIPDIDLDVACLGLETCVIDQGTLSAPTGGFHPTSPTRILDTRKGLGITNGMIRFGDGSQKSTNPLLRASDAANHDLKVTGIGGVPDSGVSAVLLNVTAIAPATDGFVTVGPRPAGRGNLFDDQHSYGPWPNASNLNTRAGQTAPNLVLARVGAGGRIRIYNYGYPMHMVADVAGWFDTGSSVTSAGGLAFTGVSPQRVLDTRHGLGGIGRFAPGDDRRVTISGVAGVPANAQSVVVNITAVSPEGTGYVTAYPSGSTVPDASNLNLTRGADRPNLAVVKIGADGAIRLRVAETSTDLLVDVQGYFGPNSGTTATSKRTTAIDPVRIFDSRNGVGTNGGRLAPGETRTVAVAGVAGIPANASAVYLNITSVGGSAWGWLAVWPTGRPRPDVSNVNWPGGTDVPNMSIVALGSDGTLQLYNDPGTSGTSTTHVLIDVMGYVV